MYQVTVTAHISAAHHLRGYEGKCEAPHGHNYKVEATAEAEGLDETGLSLDFGVLRRHLRDIAEFFDHQDLNTLPDFAEVNPSSENLARVIYERMEEAIRDLPVRMRHVKVWETEGSFVRFSKD